MATDREERAKLIEERFVDSQCILTDNFEYFSNKNRDREYSDFICLEGDPGIVIHDLVGKKDVERLLGVTPAQIAMLVPRIKIYKVRYSGPDDKEGQDIPLIFNTHVKERAVENITKGIQGRGDDVGIRSFSYTLGGKMPSQEGAATCNLKLYFQNVATFAREAESDDFAFRELFVPDPMFIDDDNNPNERIYNPKYFRIKAEVGWAPPHDPESAVLDEQTKKALDRSRTILFFTLKNYDINVTQEGTVELSIDYQGAIEGTMKSFNSDLLSAPRKEKISPQEQKSYNGLTSVDQSFNIEEGKNNITKKKKDNLKEVSIDDGDPEGLNQKKREQIKQIEIDLESKEEKYSRVIRQLISSNKLYYAIVPKSFYEGFSEEIEEGIRNFLKQNKDADITEEDARRVRLLEKQRRRRAKQGFEIRRVQYGSDLGIAKLQKKVLEQAFSLEEDRTIWQRVTGETTHKRQDTTKNINNIIQQQIATFPLESEEEKKEIENNGSRRLHFFYFGDLLSILLDHIRGKNGYDLPNFRVILGNFRYIDFNLDYIQSFSNQSKIEPFTGELGQSTASPQTGGVSTGQNQSVLVRPNQKDDSQIPRVRTIDINLADIPISLDLFVKWYLKEVVATQRNTYYFQQFIQDLVNKLIIPAVGEQCYIGTNAQRVDFRFNFFSIPKRGIPQGGRVQGQQLSEYIKTADESTHKETKNMSHVMYFYTTDTPILTLNGNYEEDTAKGVYHFTIGQDRGLIKDIKFNKTNQPHIQAFRLTSASESTKRIVNRFNATIRMVGNSLFRPGQKIYIDTSRMGDGTLGSVSKKNSISRLIGLGGYYDVVKVDYEISEDAYETILDARWVSFGGEKESQPIRVWGREANRISAIQSKIFTKIDADLSNQDKELDINKKKSKGDFPDIKLRSF